MTSRRKFLSGVAAFGAIASCSTQVFSDDKKDSDDEKKPRKLDLELVGKFVGKSHGDIETIKALLKQSPELVNASWDWGNGDFETGLNAASHVGRRDIAELLLENGARLDLPAAVMMGMRGVVKQMLKVYPKIHSVAGAHGIPLLSHAIVGKSKANGVFEVLIKSGANVNAKSSWNVTPLMVAAEVGNLSQVEILLDKGADAAAKDSKDQTALSFANKNGHSKCASAIEAAIESK